MSVTKIALLLVLALVVSPCAGADVATMSFEDFDQTLGKGWRRLAAEERYHEAALLIDEFIAKNLSAKRMVVTLNFHAGQMYASADHYVTAKKRFLLCVESSASPFAENWNAYVAATIAFLAGDREACERSRAKLASGPDEPSKAPNLVVV